MRNVVMADPTCQYSICNMCKCVPADQQCQYSIGNMCKWLGGHGKLCSRLKRQCVLHKKTLICHWKNNEIIQNVNYHSKAP